MLRALALSALLLALLPSPTWSQEEEQRQLNSTPIGEDTEVLDQFRRVEGRYIPRGEWSRIVRYYQQQLDRTDHGLFSGDGEIYLPLSIYIHQRVANLPTAGLEAYRRRIDPRAQRLYDEARQTSQLAPLSKLLRFYFNSSLGDDALALAGTLYMELGRFRQALRVLRMVHPSLGPGHLHYPDSKLDLGPIRARISYCLAALGEKYELKRLFESWNYQEYWGEQRGATNREELTQLASRGRAGARSENLAYWPYIYGSRRHTNVAVTLDRIAGPKQWIFPDSSIEARPLFLGRQGNSKPPSPLTQAVCVVSGERLYTIQADRIQAADIFNGKLVWEAPIDSQVHVTNTRGWSGNQAPSADQLRNWRVAADPVANSLSLIGKHLFSIQRTSPHYQARSSSKWNGVNVLRVYDTTREYRQLSEVPAFGGVGEKRDAFKGVYWLCTPVAYEGRAYLPGEQEGAYKMFCIDLKTLKLVWVSQMAGVTDSQASWGQVKFRAAAGSAPAAGLGNIYWASQNGAVYCLDASTGEKVWVTRYRRQGASAGAKLPPGSRAATGAWYLSPPVLASGRLVVAPRDAHQLLCYDANTGEVVWKSPQEGARLIAGVVGEQLYTAGKYLQSIHLLTGMITGRSNNGKKGEAHKDLELHGLTGRPVLTSEVAYVPTANGLQIIELARLTQLEIVPVATLFRSPGEAADQAHPRLGNLVITPPGLLFSCHSDGIAAFYSVGLQKRQIAEVSAQLKKEPENMELLQLRAERFQQFNERKKSLADYVTLYKVARKKKNGSYRITAEEGIIYLARSLNATTSDPEYILLALKYASKMMQPTLKLMLADSHEKRKQYEQALAIYRELRARYSGQFVEIDDRRRAQLDVLVDEGIRRIQAHLPTPSNQDPALRKATLTLKDPSAIPALVRQHPRSPDRALLEWVHAHWLETHGKQPAKALTRYRALLAEYPGTPAALGCLWRLVEHYERAQFPGRALRLLTQIRDRYGKVAWPPASLKMVQARWQPQQAPKKQPKKKEEKPAKDQPKKGDKDAPKEDDPKKDAPKKDDPKKDAPKKDDPKKDAPKKDDPKKDQAKAPAGPANGMAYYEAKRASKTFKSLSLPTAAGRVRPTRYPLIADDKRKLTGQSEDGDIKYDNAQIVGAFDSEQMVFIWADSRIEARSLKDWEILWRTQKIEAPSGSTTYYSYSSRGNLIRQVPATRVYRSLDRAVILHRNVLQGIHLTYGMLKWEVKLPTDKPFGWTQPRRSYVYNLTPPPMYRVVVTEDRIYALSPGGKLSAYDSQGGKLMWNASVDRLRDGRLYVVQDRVIVLAGVGASSERDYRLYRWDELSGKLLGEQRLDQPLTVLPDRLGPGGMLYLIHEQLISGVDAATGRPVWEVNFRNRVLDGVSLRDGNLVVGTGGRFELLDGRSGGSVMRGALGAQRLLTARKSGDQLYLLCAEGLTRQRYNLAVWLGAMDTRKRQQMWQTSVQSGYYPYFFDLVPLGGGAAVVASYSLHSSYNQMHLYQGGSRKHTYNVRRSSSRSYRTDLAVRHAFAYNGHLFVPEQNGLRAYRNKK